LLIDERVRSGQRATLKTRHPIQSATVSADGKKTAWRTRQAVIGRKLLTLNS
jgi:hypothetical protein